jgi:hypothetical protein
LKRPNFTVTLLSRGRFKPIYMYIGMCYIHIYNVHMYMVYTYMTPLHSTTCHVSSCIPHIHIYTLYIYTSSKRYQDRCAFLFMYAGPMYTHVSSSSYDTHVSSSSHDTHVCMPYVYTPHTACILLTHVSSSSCMPYVYTPHTNIYTYIGVPF